VLQKKSPPGDKVKEVTRRGTAKNVERVILILLKLQKKSSGEIKRGKKSRKLPRFFNNNSALQCQRGKKLGGIRTPPSSCL
jgi:hypothetical protein